MLKKRYVFALIVAMGLVGLLVISAAGDLDPGESYESYFFYTGTRPTEAENDYSHEVQGITHDRDNWFISQVWALWRIPVGLDLAGSIECGVSGVVCEDLSNVGEIQAFNHVGDIDHYQYESGGFLLLPLTGGSNRALAVFNPANLQYIAHTELPQHSTGSWVAVHPDGLVYTPSSSYWVYMYDLDWDRLAQDRTLSLQEVGRFQLLDESGVPLGADQGGEFSESGNLLYTNNGYLDDYDSHKDGISVFDTQTKRRIAHSTTDSTQPFWYYYDWGVCDNDPGYCGEEPEGLTIWDLDEDPRAPEGISGQLHVLVLDNDLSHDDVYIRHYTGTIYVDSEYSGEERGTPTRPFNTVGEAHDLAWDGSRIKIRAGSYPETLTFSKRTQVLAVGGTVTIIGE